MEGSYSSSGIPFISGYQLSLHIGICCYQLSNSQGVVPWCEGHNLHPGTFFMLYRLDIYRCKILLEQILFTLALLYNLSFFCLTVCLCFSPLRTSYTLGYGARMEWRDATWVQRDLVAFATAFLTQSLPHVHLLALSHRSFPAKRHPLDVSGIQ